MNSKTLWVAMALMLATSAHAQTAKPGLWETTSDVKVEGARPAPQVPPDVLAKMEERGVTVPNMHGNQKKYKSCVTQQMIEKYGGLPPHDNCDVSNARRTATTFSADMTCSGPLNGKGTVQSTRIDDDHVKSTIYFKGTNQFGRPLEWTMQTTSVYLGAACGDVLPDHPILVQ